MYIQTNETIECKLQRILSVSTILIMQPLSLSAAHGGGRAEREDSRQRGSEKVSSSVKWRQLVLPLCGILFVYRSVVHVLVPWANLIDTSEVGMDSPYPSHTRTL